MKPNHIALGIAFALGTIPSIARNLAYDKDSATSYARSWAFSRNSQYRDFSSNTNDGGDCTNFGSQVLRAGGLTNTGTSTTSDQSWFYNSTTQSQTWTVAHSIIPSPQ